MPKKKKSPSAKRATTNFVSRNKCTRDWMKYLVQENEKRYEWMREHEYRKHQDD